MSDDSKSGAYISCPHCKFTLRMSEEELYLFFGNFACLRCRKKVDLPLDQTAYRRLRMKNNRNTLPPSK